jgi:hypothetical protein
MGSWTISGSVENMLRCMLNPNADLRYTAGQALLDPYWSTSDLTPLSPPPLADGLNSQRKRGQFTTIMPSSDHQFRRSYPTKACKGALSRRDSLTMGNTFHAWSWKGEYCARTRTAAEDALKRCVIASTGHGEASECRTGTTTGVPRFGFCMLSSVNIINLIHSSIIGPCRGQETGYRNS